MEKNLRHDCWTPISSPPYLFLCLVPMQMVQGYLVEFIHPHASSINQLSSDQNAMTKLSDLVLGCQHWILLKERAWGRGHAIEATKT